MDASLHPRTRSGMARCVGSIIVFRELNLFKRTFCLVKNALFYDLQVVQFIYDFVLYIIAFLIYCGFVKRVIPESGLTESSVVNIVSRKVII